MDRFEIIVLGATGFTGKFVTKRLAAIHRNSEHSDITWAISGRSMEKMTKLLSELEELGTNVTKIPIVECDVQNEKSLLKMSSRAKVVLNCVGPYTTLGERVVKACIQTGTHYLDLSSELHFMLDMFQKYHEAAQKANVLVITACGFGSIPAVMGYVQLEKNFQGVLKAIECYVEIELPRRAYLPGPNRCLVHYGTWASMVHEMKNRKQYLACRNKSFPQPLIAAQESSVLERPFIHRNKGRYWIPYVGPDGDIIDMTQRYLRETVGKRPVIFKNYVTMPTLIHMIIYIPVFILAYLLCYFKCFRKLMWKYPQLLSFGYMSHKGPSEEMRKETKFNFVLIGRGWDKDSDNNDTPYHKSMTLKVSGYDPGYETTAISCVLSAVTLLRESSRMPSGGVLTTGAAFWNTRLVHRLNSGGITFETIDGEP